MGQTSELSVCYYCFLILDSEELLFGMLLDTIETETGHATRCTHVMNTLSATMSGKVKMKKCIDGVTAYWLHCVDTGQTSELNVCYYCFLILDSEELLFGMLSDTIEMETGHATGCTHVMNTLSATISGKNKMENWIDSVIAY